jgi:hypothetical protein
MFTSTRLARTFRASRQPNKSAVFSSAKAVLQLLYTEAPVTEWLFPQEKATLHDLQMATCESKTL